MSGSLAESNSKQVGHHNKYLMYIHYNNILKVLTDSEPKLLKAPLEVSQLQYRTHLTICIPYYDNQIKHNLHAGLSMSVSHSGISEAILT